MINTINHRKLIALGFSKSSAKQIIRDAKEIAIRQFYEASNSSDKVVGLSKSPFDNRRLDLAPTVIVEALLGFRISD